MARPIWRTGRGQTTERILSRTAMSLNGPQRTVNLLEALRRRGRGEPRRSSQRQWLSGERSTMPLRFERCTIDFAKGLQL